MEDAVQLAFDFDEFEREDARARLHEWAGAPLHFTTDYYPPAMLDEAFGHWKFLNGDRGSFARSHMWHRSLAHGSVEFAEHRAESFTADLRPERGVEGPGDLLTMLVCEPCDWHSIAGNENEAVEAWHDHAMPGWRDLPVIPQAVRVRSETGLTKVALRWIEQLYPVAMQVPGAPVRWFRQDHRAARPAPGVDSRVRTRLDRSRAVGSCRRSARRLARRAGGEHREVPL